MNKTGLIVEREFAERVRKKSFIITTLLMPLFMIALMAAPTLIMLWGKSSAKTVVVVDNTPGQLVGSKLESGETITYQLLSEGTTLGQARSQYSNADQAYAILVIGSDIVDNPQNIQFIMNDASSMSIEENIQRQIQGILRTERLSRYEMDNIDQILSDANLRVSLRTLKNNGQEDEEKGMEATSTSASYIMGLVLGMLLYLILIIYGQQVLQSVIDEKQTRVLDVMVTSCTPFELMMGKILGIAVVAALQIVIWAVLVIGASAFIMPLIMGNAGVDAANAVASAASSSDVMSIVGKFTNVSYLAGLFLELLLYIVGGFLFYAAMYAAIGSSVDTPQDAAQFNGIIMMPIILAIYVMMTVMNDPNSGLVFWCSMIPFTSPIVMMARIPFGIPTWEIIVSIVVLFISFFIMTWIAARIFRVGVFMHGKKPSWKDLGAWIKMK
ncbi:MAG: ABC transporter permease [Bacteroidaceae bacterium]|nr:ABC transporter permease [Bacteroidaceae bacterium]